MSNQLPDSVSGIVTLDRTVIRNGINAKARTWTSPTTGLVLKLKPVSIGLMNRIRSDRTGRPDVPMVHVKYGEQDAFEPNPDDPVYKQKYADWQEDINTRQAVFMYSSGVDITVPDEFVAQVKEWATNPTASELRYYYVTALVPPAEYDSLMQAILSQTSPTENGIADASAAFPDDGQR